MHKPGVGDFKYFVGIRSLAQIATRQDRLCVLNILGTESARVTPIGHAYSGGNVVFGTSPGRRGQTLETPLGPIPVYNSVLEGLEAGHRFNCGIVYLPPAAARDGVAELIRVNPALEKIVIVTEKISIHDAREIRAMGQQNGIDIFGGNSLGVADAWHRVRIGGALGGDDPAETLRKGSIAILSNSGNFTTTIATYLRMAGWGTTTVISSGKDVYIHFAAPEFAFALTNDPRSKAAVLYVEPGGFYELEADFTKPVVACVVGRWKNKLTRAVGHAGAMAGGSDDAAAKEHWFMSKLEVDAIFTPEQPTFSKKGALVTNIAHVPAAMTAVMQASGISPDFVPAGSLALKPWFGSNQELGLPTELDLAVVEAIPPYGAQIKILNQYVGALFARQEMKDASGASRMDAKTQVTSVYGMSILDLAREPLEASFALPLLHEIADKNDRALLDIAVAGEVNLVGDPALAAADAAREAGNAPNSVMAAAASIIGPGRVARALACADKLINLFAHSGLTDARDESFDLAAVAIDPEDGSLFLATAADEDVRPALMIKAVRERGARSVFVRMLESLGAPVHRDAVLAALATTIAWRPLMSKRISRVTARTLPWYLRLYGVMIGASIPGELHQRGSLCGVSRQERFAKWTMADFAFLAITGRKPTDAESRPLQILIGLLVSNGPGTISAQGAKGAVSADGPQTPARVQINKAMVGFLTHTGYSHGGNGFEGIEFLLDRFKDRHLNDPTNAEHGLSLKEMARDFACAYAREKKATKELAMSGPRALPGVHHPIFKGNSINFDPRERFIVNIMHARGEYNIFLDYYHHLVQALYEAGASPYVFCVNIDAVIASLLLALLWNEYKAGTLSRADLETAAFTVFLYGRMIGCAAEIDDHLNRGRNMDTRTPASSCRFVV
jgi:succinyl-CoA synthetase alpha subunit